MAVADRQLWVFGEPNISDNDNQIWVFGEPWIVLDSTIAPTVPVGINSTLHPVLGLGGYNNQGGRIPHLDMGIGMKRHPRSRVH